MFIDGIKFSEYEIGLLKDIRADACRNVRAMQRILSRCAPESEEMNMARNDETVLEKTQPDHATLDQIFEWSLLAIDEIHSEIDDAEDKHTQKTLKSKLAQYREIYHKALKVCRIRAGLNEEI